ncbi:hypothetical protein ASZ90_002532 [hydrocarbon metagenome]|uniref:Uncharacterized protein n=1 Tax=hydrocarbon metagenome TaxID=938273 RepID=A0A0W8G3E5_9ZZZZ
MGNPINITSIANGCRDVRSTPPTVRRLGASPLCKPLCALFNDRA